MAAIPDPGAPRAGVERCLGSAVRPSQADTCMNHHTRIVVKALYLGGDPRWPRRRSRKVRLREGQAAEGHPQQAALCADRSAIPLGNSGLTGRTPLSVSHLRGNHQRCFPPIPSLRWLRGAPRGAPFLTHPTFPVHRQGLLSARGSSGQRGSSESQPPASNGPLP